MMRTIIVWMGAVLMAGGLWSASGINQGLADEPAAPRSSTEATGGAAGKETGGSETAPPMVEGELALPAEAGQVQEPTVSLTQAVHFTDATGQDVVVGPGSYWVEPEGTNRIRLLPAETAEAVVIDAVRFTHQQPVERPVPVTVPDPQQPDVLHLALLSPGGTGLDAIGTYSGVKPRAVTDMMFVTSQIATQYTATTTGKLALVPGITGPRPTTLAPPDRYTAPTANLTAVANALQLRYKSLATVVTIQPELQVTQPVEISIGYYSPAGNARITQSYVRGTGNRFFYFDREGDGKPRRMRMDISLMEPRPGGQPYTFAFSWQVDLDPLYDVTISPLRFSLIDNCDFQFPVAQDSEIVSMWYSPDKLFGSQARNMRAGGLAIFDRFAWARAEVSAAANLIKPVVGFVDNDPGYPWQVGEVLGLPSGGNLVPGKSETLRRNLTALKPNNCRAYVEYTISYTLHVDYNQPLSVTQVVDPTGFAAPITAADADSILADAGTVLQTKDSANDVACPVELTRAGEIARVFGPASIDSDAELQQVFSLPGYVKVVDEINYCAGLNPSVIGCAPNRPTLVVERYTANQEGILWAHEHGHTKGLGHRDPPAAIMYPYIGGREVNATECAAFQR